MSHKADVQCPCCGHTVTVTYHPGSPAVWYPNDRAQPAEPPEIQEVEGCECWDYLDFLYERVNTGPGMYRFQGALEKYDYDLWETLEDTNL